MVGRSDAAGRTGTGTRPAAGAYAGRSDAARATCADTTAECRAFLAQDVAVAASPGTCVCAWPGGYAPGSSSRRGWSGCNGAPARSGRRDTAGACLRAGSGAGCTGHSDRLRSRVTSQRCVSAAADTQSCAAGGTRLAAHADSADRTCDVGRGSAVQRRALARNESGLASCSCAERRVGAGDAASGGGVSTKSRLTGETGLAGNSRLTGETSLPSHPGLSGKARLAGEARLGTCRGARLTTRRDSGLGTSADSGLGPGADTAT
ncbi:hypothetical protein [Mycobacterium paragordonae]|uniref:hypothetical protein n=1 Tax=Mycobacterium paragordonae TaxID=1389713 RepID=UPI001F0DBF68|nr:hypothetical protein [Mycobacterium paragordonae]